MKKLLSLLIVVTLSICTLCLLAFVTGNSHLIKGVWATYLHGASGPTIDDARFFDTNNINAANSSWQWPLHADYNKSELTPNLQSVFKETGTVAFLIIHNDSILFENYADGYPDNTLSNSFSMSKSITTMLAQIAIQKGFLKSWKQKVKPLVPELKGVYADSLELWHLSCMCSGLIWNESYTNPWSITAKTYYGRHVRRMILDLPIDNKPGEKFNYQSGNTELLAFCLMKATGKSLSELASEWLWKPMEAEHDAKWHTDNTGTELAWCCFNSNARDFARFGKLLLHHGNWNGTQLIDTPFIQMATTALLDSAYGYSFWLDQSQGTKAAFMWGLGGQYIITIPEHRLNIVRLGHQDILDKREYSEYTRILIGEVLQMLSKREKTSGVL